MEYAAGVHRKHLTARRKASCHVHAVDAASLIHRCEQRRRRRCRWGFNVAASKEATSPVGVGRLINICRVCLCIITPGYSGWWSGIILQSVGCCRKLLVIKYWTLKKAEGLRYESEIFIHGTDIRFFVRHEIITFSRS